MRCNNSLASSSRSSLDISRSHALRGNAWDVVEFPGEMNARFTCGVDKFAESVNLSSSKPAPTLS